MSNAALTWAFEAPVRGVAKAVLLALAYCADDEGHCAPTTKTITRYAGATTRAVQNALTALYKSGCVTVFRTDGATSSYALHVGFIFPERAVYRKPKRPSKWGKLRLRAFQRDGERCAYCHAVSGPWEIDHIIPKSRGGADRLENLTVSCRPCNQAKGARMVEEWRQ